MSSHTHPTLRYWITAGAIVLFIAAHGIIGFVLAHKLVLGAVGSGVILLIVILHLGGLAPVRSLLRRRH
jgi:hypothetical protein